MLDDGDLIDCAILVEAPRVVREERLLRREDPALLEARHRRWDGADDYYFTELRRRALVDVVVDSLASRVLLKNAEGGGECPSFDS